MQSRAKNRVKRRRRWHVRRSLVWAVVIMALYCNVQQIDIEYRRDERFTMPKLFTAVWTLLRPDHWL